MIRTFYSILCATVVRLDSIMASFAGFVMSVVICCVNFLAGYKFAISVVLFSVVMDMIWGIAAAKSKGKYTRSELMRDTINKVGAYASALVMVMFIENLIAGSHQIGVEDGATVRWGVDIVASIISIVEAWSVCGNILIVWPNAVFFRIIRMPLIGEIARKLNVSEDEVKEIFNEQDKKNNKKK